MGLPIITEGIGLVKESIKLLTLLAKTSHVRRMRKAVGYGENYIREDEKLVNETDPKKRKRIYNLKRYNKIKFFKFNQ